MKKYIKNNKIIAHGTPIMLANGRMAFNPTEQMYLANGYSVVLKKKSEWISEQIHTRFSIDDEIALINNRDDKPEEYQEYMQFRADVKAEANRLVSLNQLSNE